LFLTHQDDRRRRDNLRYLRGDHLGHKFLSVEARLEKFFTFRVEEVLVNHREL
jgi:hypothetical protein